MNKLSKILNYVMMIAVVASLTMMMSCGEDDTPVIVKEEGIPVADGFYITESGVDPTSSAQLTAESVEDDGFGAQSRDSYFANYVYLKAGNHTIVNIVSKKITETFGGTVTTGDNASADCELNEYAIVATAKDGAAFSVASAGLYKVTFDKTTGESILYKIEKVGLIGSATPGGWGSDTDLAGTVAADGGTWTATGVVLRKGEFKVRFNCNWNIDRRIDSEAGFAANNGYMLFTNFGGSLDNLLPGNDGSNIGVSEVGGSAPDEAEYTVTVTWTGKDGFKVGLERTGEAPVITFVPDEHQWGVIGDATPTGWDSDTDMNYDGVDAGTYTWTMTTGSGGGGSLDFIEGGFKFRANNAWDENMGWGGKLTLTGDMGEFSDDGGNIHVSAAGAGTYKITLTTSDDGDSYTANFEKQ